MQGLAPGRKATLLEMTEKLANLEKRLAFYGRLAVAFSGGVDSSFLLAKAAEVLGVPNVVAVTVRSVLAPAFEMQRAQWFCEDHGVRQLVVDADPLADDKVRGNGDMRCYHCKKGIFSLAMDAARAEGFDVLADGTNSDDAGDYRPGAKAVSELGVESPLRDASLTKDDIRELSREMGLSIWDAPSCACLATRVAYGTPLDPDVLKRIDDAEDFLRKLDFSPVRVRVHGDVARIEVGRTQVARLSEPATRLEVVDPMKQLGFAYVCADLEGFRSGSMNETMRGEADA